GDGAGDRPVDRKRIPEVRGVTRNETRSRAKADAVAEARRVAKAATAIRTVRNGNHPRGDRGRGAAARAADRPSRVVGVARRAEDRVEGLRAGTVLGRVRLADDDR